jgi:hypothetical protein
MKSRCAFVNLLWSAGVLARRARRPAGHMFQNFCVATPDWIQIGKVFMKTVLEWVFILGFAVAGYARATDGKGQALANIEGKVIVAATGQPVSGVKLRWLATNDMREPVLSGPDGAFRMADIAPGKAAITAVFPGEPVADWVAEDVLVTVASGETKKDVLVRALKGGVAAITVLSRNGRQPLINVPVSVSSQLSSSPLIVMTGADGVARLRLLPDRWYITVKERSGSLDDWQTEVQVVTGRTNHAEILVATSLKITGTVLDPSGAPAVGAVVSLGGTIVSGQEVRTDANGRYEFMNDVIIIDGQVSLLTAHSADGSLAVIHDIDEDTTNLDLTLQPSVTISGTVEDAKGRPVTNATAIAYLSGRLLK